MAIDGIEKRDVATADVAGAYLQTPMMDHVIVKISGKAAEIMMEVNPRFKETAMAERNEKVLYLKLMKALYRCMQSALLCYDTFKGHLEKEGFRLNEYDKCVANRDYEGSQCNIVWYVDDCKISQVNLEVVTSVIEMLEKRFGKMAVKRRKEHTFVGMNISFKDEGVIELEMLEYIKE